MRILHLADLHLGWEPRYLPEDKRQQRRQERDRLLEKTVDFALKPENETQVVLIVGDLFENYNPEEKLVRHVMDQLSRLTRAGLQVVTVPGNHDEITYRESVYRRYGDNWPGTLVRNPNPDLVATLEVNGSKLHIYSLAFTGGLTSISGLEEFPRNEEEGIHLAAFHGSLDWTDIADRSLPLDSSLLARAGYNFIALGHYHRHMEKQAGSAKTLYPGAIEFKTFRDRGTGCLSHVELADNLKGSNVKIETYPVDVRENFSKKIDLSKYENPEDLHQACSEFADEEAMVQITLTGTPRFPVNHEALEDELAPYFFYLEVKNEANYFDESFLESIGSEPTVRGAYVRRMREKQKEAATEQEKNVLEQALLKGLAALEGSDAR